MCQYWFFTIIMISICVLWSHDPIKYTYNFCISMLTKTIYIRFLMILNLFIILRTPHARVIFMELVQLLNWSNYLSSNILYLNVHLWYTYFDILILTKLNVNNFFINFLLYFGIFNISILTFYKLTKRIKYYKHKLTYVN